MIPAHLQEKRTHNIAAALDLYCSVKGKQFDFVDFIGEGGCGVVYELIDTDSGKSVILKAVDTGITEIGCSNEAMNEYVRREIRSLKLCAKHENIIDMFDSFYCCVDEYKGEMVYLMFLPKLVPVNEYFMKNKNDEKSIIAMTADICKALSFCHKNKILHRDVKPGNIYYSPEKKRFILADFGLSRSCFNPERAVTMIGTYLAPEILMGKPLKDSKGNERYNSDIFSLGITSLLLLAAFNGGGDQREYLKKMEPKELRVIISKAIATDPELRYQTADELSADIMKIDWDKKDAVYSADVDKCLETLLSGKQSKAKAMAEQGHENGDIRMSCILAYIMSSEGNAKEALAMLKKLKKTGDRVVLGLYGIIGCTYFGSSAEYKECMVESAKKGFCLAQYFIGRWTADGQNGFTANFNEGFDLVHAASRQGFLPAIDYLRKALKRKKVESAKAMIDLLEAELEDYDDAKDFPVFSILAVAMG